MNTEPQSTSTALARFDIADDVIANMRGAYMALRITDIDDKPMLATIRNARLEVKSVRVRVEKVRVELKAEALEWGRTVDAEAKRIAGMLAPIEDHLSQQENLVAEHKARLLAETEAAKLAARRETLDSRMAQLMAVSSRMMPSQVEWISDADFASLLARETETFRADQYAEAARQATEAAQRAHQDALAAALSVEAERLNAEREALATLLREAEAQAKAEIEAVARAAAAERAAFAEEMRQLQARDAEARAAREAEIRKAEAARKDAELLAAAEREKVAAEARRVAEAKRRADMLPHKEKLAAYADALVAIEIPGTPFDDEVREIVREAAAAVRWLGA